jgi:hypothetical protein
MKTIIKNTAFLTCLFLGLSFGLVSASHASLVITSNQSVDVNGKYLPAQPANIPDPRLDFSTSYNSNNSGGITEFDFELGNKGIDEGSVLWDIGIEQARLRSFSDLRIINDFGINPNPHFTDLNVDVSSSISYGDTITVRALTPDDDPVPINLNVRFQVDLTGNLFNNVNYNDPNNDGGASRADYFTEATFFSHIASSSGDANEDWQVEETSNTHSNGRFGGNVDEMAIMNSSVIFEDLLWKGQALFFDWTYSELFNVDIEGIDAGYIDIQMQNDLSHTILTRASVFDDNGNWLPNYVVESSGGFDYAQISAANPINAVNAPSLTGLLLCSFIGMLLKKRSKRA